MAVVKPFWLYQYASPVSGFPFACKPLNDKYTHGNCESI